MKLNHWMHHFPVQQKIVVGYVLSLGIAIAGTTLGVVIADRQQQNADIMGQDALEEIEIITQLRISILQSIIDQKQISESFTDSLRLQRNYETWRKHYIQFKESWEEFQETEGGTKGQEEIERDEELIAIEKFLTKHKGVPEAYIKSLDQLLFKSTMTPFTVEETTRLKSELERIEKTGILDQVDGLVEDLKEISDITYEEYEEASLGIKESNTLRLSIIAISMIISVAIAIILSLLTSRAIAQPIRSLTNLTEQALNESNFDLQVKVTTQDEIGSLALSFNRLISSVKILLDKQHQYTQILEEKVNERTQELNDRNIQLQELLDKLHNAQLQMVQSEKMSSLGQLVAGVAHEINNPVSFIHGNLVHVQEYTYNLLSFIRLYQKFYPTPVMEIDREAGEIDLEFLQEDMPKLINSMQIGTDRIREIVVSLRNFSRTDQSEFKLVNIHEGIDSTLLILQHRLKAVSNKPETQIIRNYGDLPRVECYPGQLNQVLMNILANAIDALDESNTTITDQKIEEHPSQIEISTSLLDTKLVQIKITDNGVGMSEATRKQIFDPFFTTKHIGKGTGMGMAISYQIITEKHGGKLECYSAIGEGTSFIIQIPVQQIPSVLI